MKHQMVHHYVQVPYSKDSSLSKNTINGSPSSSTRHENKFLVADINDQDIPELKKIVSGVKVDSETTEGNCQDYILETLEVLE